MSTAVRTIYVELRASAEKLRADMAAGEVQLDRIGKSGKAAGTQISAGMDKAHESFGHVVKNATEAALAIEGAAKGIAKYSSIAAASGATTENLANTYRALRIALSPTPLTVATVATGLLVEETIRLTNARAKLIEQQALMAATKGRSIAGIEAIHGISSASGSNEGAVQGLIDAAEAAKKTQGFKSALSSIGMSSDDFSQSSWPAFLAKVAQGFDSISDPADRARVAVQLFGKEHAGEALEQLTPAFANAAEAAGNLGYALNSTARQQITAFRHDLLDLKGALLDFSKERTWVDAVKSHTAEVTAAYYDMAKRGTSALGRLISKQTGLGGLGVNPDDFPDDIGASERGRKESVRAGLSADDLLAQAQGSANRKAETFAGRLKAYQEAQAQYDATFTALVLDQQKRHADPNDPTLLTNDQRFGLAVRQQSSQGLAAGLGEQIKGVRQAPELINSRIAANQQIIASDKQKAENAINLLRLTLQAQIDGIQDAHERTVAAADVDLSTAQSRLAKLTPIYQNELATRIALIQKRAAAEAAMEGPDEAGRAEIAAQREIEAAHAETSAKIVELANATTEAQIRAGNALLDAQRAWGKEIEDSWSHSYDAVQKKARDTFIVQNSPGAYRVLAGQQVSEIEARGKGSLDELAVQQEKLKVERAAGVESTRTQQEQIRYMQQIAVLNEKASAAKIDGLNADLRLAEVEAAAVAGTEKQIEADKKVAELKQQIAQLSGEAANATYDAQTKIQQAIDAPKWSSYFARLRAEAKTSAEIMQESMTSAIDGVAGSLADLATGKKANWGQMLQNLGNQMAKDSIKSIMQRGLSSVLGRDPVTGAQRGVFGGGAAGGGIFNLRKGVGDMHGIGPSAGFSKPDGTPMNPYYVVLVQQQAQQSTQVTQTKQPGFWGSFLGSLVGALGGAAIGGIGGGGGGSTPSSSSSITYGDIVPDGARAGGGSVSPGQAYLVGEKGPEILTGMSGHVHSNSESRKMLGGDTHNYYIDAAPGVSREEMFQAVTAAHRSSVSTSVQANVEFSKRRPA